MSQEQLEQKVVALEADVQNIGRNLNKLTHAVESLSDKITQNSQTNWSVLAAWSAVIITILGGLGYLALSPTQEMLKILEQRVYEHQFNGHTEVKVRLESIDKRVDDLKQTK